ncbi:histone-fold-containing protein, partial [Backusella circina FSU 941]
GPKTSQARSQRASLMFPVGRVHRYLHHGHYASRLAKGTPVYLATVIEYISAEVMELAGSAVRDHKSKTIEPHHIELVIRSDEELNKVLECVIIYQTHAFTQEEK